MPTDQAMEAIAAYLYYKEGLSVYDFRAKANTTQYVTQADNGSVFTAEAGSAADLYVGAGVTKLSFTNLPVGNYDAAEITVGEQSWKTGIRGADGYTPVNGAIPVADGTVLHIAVTKQDGQHRELDIDRTYQRGCGDESGYGPDRRIAGCGRADPG